MTDYPDLFKRLMREINQQTGALDSGTDAFVKRFVQQLQAEGYQLGPEAEAELNHYLSGIRPAIATGITTGLATGGTALALGSAEVAKLTEDAFNKRWPDGITLSDRLWKFNQETRTGITKVLSDGARQGASVNRLVMEMQRTIERANGAERFKIIERQKDDWVKNLHKAGQDLIHNPAARADWNAAVDAVETRILSLSKTGSRTAAQQVLKQISAAVEKGSEQLMDKAVRWWVYDKQLYNLKRIARTEMSTAMHRAVIASADNDPDVIGYQWRLSSSHPAPDVCDYYANIDMGLGKGVWSKETVPREKAHPHCMCLLIPRVTAIKTKGKASYAEFIENASEAQQKKLLPKWAQRLKANGVSMEDLVRPDGLWSLSKKQMIARLGQTRFDELMREVSKTPFKDGVDYVISNGKRLQNSKTEFAYIHDGTGKVLVQKKGQKSSVSFTREEIELIRRHRDVEIIHNHPSGGTLSSADFKFQYNSQAKVIHAIGHNDVYYKGSMLRDDLFDNEYRNANSATKRQFVSWINADTMTVAQAEQFHFEVVNRVLRSKGVVDYQITKNASMIDDAMPDTVRKLIRELSDG